MIQLETPLSIKLNVPEPIFSWIIEQELYPLWQILVFIIGLVDVVRDLLVRDIQWLKTEPELTALVLTY